jgi:integrase
LRRERENHRQQYGDRMFEASEIRQILSECDQPMKAMVLLACNCAFGQGDVSALPLRTVDLNEGWIDFARVKTSVRRKIPLWPETVSSIEEWLEVRPKAKNPDDDHLMFLTVRGRPWVRVNKTGTRTDALGQEFNKLIRKLNLKRPKVSFYAMRHGFETIGGESRDQAAVSALMGHIDGLMSSHYRERISDQRLKDVVNVIRDWLFGDDDQSADTEEEHTLKISN